MTNLIKRQSNKPGNLWDDFFNDGFENIFSLVPQRIFSKPETLREYSWHPRVDVHETEDALIFDAEMPGVKEDDVEVTVENNVLTIKGERKFEKDNKSDNYHRVERHYGSFQRIFSLPNNLNTSDVTANYSEGILEIKFPKKPESKPKKVVINPKK